MPLEFVDRTTARVWRWSKRLLPVFRESGTTRAIFSPDGQSVVSQSVRQLTEVEVTCSFGTVPWVIPKLSSDGAILGRALPTNNLEIWDTKTWTKRCVIPCAYQVFDLSPDGQLAIAPDRVTQGPPGRNAAIFSTQSGKQLRTLEEHSGQIQSMRFSSCGRYVLTCSDDGTARVWSADSGQQLHLVSMPGIEGERSEVHDAILIDDRRMITASGDSARVWDYTTGQLIHEFGFELHSAHSIELSPNKRHALIRPSNPWGSHFSERELVVRLLDIENGEIAQEFRGHAEAVRWASLSPCGSLVATGSVDQSVRIWSVETGEELVTLRGHNDAVAYVEFSRSGDWVVSTSKDGTIRVWPVDVLAYGVDSAPRELTSEEKARYTIQ